MDRDAILKQLLEGQIAAISVDTCIFGEARYGLEHGNLRQLEQFKENAFQLVFSEVTVREVLKHITKEAEDSKASFEKSLNSVGNYWNIPKDTQKPMLQSLFGERTPNEIARERLNGFMERCGVELLQAEKYLDVTALLGRYFSVEPPFEKKDDKKAEFPDAIALMTLEAWAKKEKTKALFVTRDKGCHAFCEQSEWLVSIDNLGEALALIQQRDEHAASMCLRLAQLIYSGAYPQLSEEIETTISEDIWSVDWAPEAASSYYYDAFMQDVEVLEVEFSDHGGVLNLEPVDYRVDKLVAKVTMQVSIRAECSFTFFVKDYVDKDMVTIGDSKATRRDKFDLDVLIIFEEPNSGLPPVAAIELIPTHRWIDFGEAEPEWDDDPTHEKY